MFYRSILHYKQFRYLGAFYLHSLIRHFANSIFQIFNSIYIFQLLQKEGLDDSKALGITTIFFALVYLFQALFIPFSLWLIKTKGLRFNITWGNLMLISFLISVYLAGYNIIFLVPAFILSGLQIALYWTAYHIYFAEVSDDKRQGEEVALVMALSIIVGMGGPVLGGVLINYWGFGAVFIMISILLLLSNLPMRHVSKEKDTVHIVLAELIKTISSKKQRLSYLAIGGEAVIDTVDIYFWPLTIFLIVTGFITLGFIGSLVAFFSSIITIILGKAIDKYGAKAVIRVISSLDSLIWISKAFITTPVQAYVASIAQGATVSGQYMSLQAMIYEKVRHHNSIAFILQREITLSLGKVFFLVPMGILFWSGMPLAFIFIFAAAATLFTRFYPEEKALT